MFKPDKLAYNIRQSRVKMGLTQLELAEKLFVSSQAISKWESGQSVPDLANLCFLAEIFATSVDKLMGNTLNNSEGKVLIGIDGGATKTEFLLFTESGHIINRALLDGCNPNACGMEKTQAILKSGIDSLLAINSEVSGVFAGIAGYLSGDNSVKIDEFFKKNYPLLNVSVNSDICNVIASATDLDKCAAVICGTGFSIYSSVHGELNRVGGWGYLLDCMGGGYDFGREALRASLAERDGFGKKTMITSIVEQKIGGTVWKNIHKVYSGGDSFIASFAPAVFEAYEKGDEVATEILNQNADRIVYLVKFAISTYDCGNNVVMAGGLLSKSDVLISLIKEKLGKDVNLIVPVLPQIFGACIRCCKEFGTPGKEFYENFKNGYNY